MLNKAGKVKFVEQAKKEISNYSVVGVIQLGGVPDRLFQSSRNRLRPGSRFITGKKTILTKILENDERTKKLVGELSGTSAIILSNEDPFELFRKFNSNRLRLGAKPKQISPDDINIQAGETSVQPGQAVTELKQAGIDVQIQKGKVVIAKDKVLVQKGAVISPAVAKALKTLDIMPFNVVLTPQVLLQGNLAFTKEVLSIDPLSVSQDISRGFGTALALCFKAKIVNSYTISTFIEQAYRSAMAVGLAGGAYEKGIVEKLIANAANAAASLNSMVKEEAPAPQPPAQPAQ